MEAYPSASARTDVHYGSTDDAQDACRNRPGTAADRVRELLVWWKGDSVEGFTLKTCAVLCGAVPLLVAAPWLSSWFTQIAKQVLLALGFHLASSHSLGSGKLALVPQTGQHSILAPGHFEGVPPPGNSSAFLSPDAGMHQLSPWSFILLIGLFSLLIKISIGAPCIPCGAGLLPFLQALHPFVGTRLTFMLALLSFVMARQVLWRRSSRRSAEQCSRTLCRASRAQVLHLSTPQPDQIQETRASTRWFLAFDLAFPTSPGR